MAIALTWLLVSRNSEGRGSERERCASSAQHWILRECICIICALPWVFYTVAFSVFDSANFEVYLKWNIMCGSPMEMSEKFFATYQQFECEWKEIERKTDMLCLKIGIQNKSSLNWIVWNTILNSRPPHKNRLSFLFLFVSSLHHLSSESQMNLVHEIV